MTAFHSGADGDMIKAIRIRWIKMRYMASVWFIRFYTKVIDTHYTSSPFLCFHILTYLH